MSTFRANGFDSVLPAGWVDRSTIALVGPTSSDGFAANIVVTRQPLAKGTTATRFARAQLEALEAEIGEVKVDDERTARFKDREVFQRVHAIRADDRWIRQLQSYFAVELDGETVGFVITGSATPNAFDRVLPDFKRFIEMFEPRDRKDRR